MRLDYCHVALEAYRAYWGAVNCEREFCEIMFADGAILVRTPFGWINSTFAK